MALSPTPDSIVDDSEFVNEVYAQVRTLLGCSMDALPPLVKQMTSYILGGGEQPQPSSQAEKAIPGLVKKAFRELLTEYPYEVPENVWRRLK